MLEELFIFTRSGLILWALGGLKSSPIIDAVVRSCLLEDRFAGFSHGTRAVKCAFQNELGLVFAAVYQRALRLPYVDGLLAAVRGEFSRIYDPKRANYDAFGDVFRQLHLEAQARADETKMSKSKQAVGVAPPRLTPTVKTGPNRGGGGSHGNGGGKKGGGSRGNGGGKKGGGSDDGGGGSGEKEIGGGTKDDEAFDLSLLQQLRNKFIPRRIGGTGDGTKKKNIKPAETTIKAQGKRDRVWDDESSPPDRKLDFSDPADGHHATTEHAPVDLGKSKMDTDEKVEQGPIKRGWFSSMFQSIAAGYSSSVLGKSDLQPAIKALKDRLMTKNVAEEIAEKLCESVAASLEGKKLGSFASTSSTVEAAMEEALLRILTPSRSIDVLRDVHAARERGRPYIIVFVGVNGVGKSTNLAKVAYWLLQHELSVTLAACDTFRSGAVEQLRTHARRLQIPIFEKGYQRDPAVVAKEAIQEASRNKSDVVLVDTAGRMQDNEPLMRALSKLIDRNSPDLVLFVGEALVGNDAVDQLTKFNQRLADLSAAPSARSIDGILLTKFDTIDDKVGAALSMVYVSGAPVMFVGCGQSYTDLKKLDVKSIVRTLLK